MLVHKKGLVHGVVFGLVPQVDWSHDPLPHSRSFVASPLGEQDYLHPCE